MFVSPICASSARRRGEADARITRRLRRMFSAGRLSGTLAWGARPEGEAVGAVMAV